MNYIVWIAALIGFALVEAATTGLVCVWFAVGSAAALIMTILGGGILAQLTAFVLFSGAALVLTRPLAERFGSAPTTPTNADRVLGQVCTVTEDVDEGQGAVYVDGKTWSARSADGLPISGGSRAQVEAIEGVKLLVKRVS